MCYICALANTTDARALLITSTSSVSPEQAVPVRLRGSFVRVRAHNPLSSKGKSLHVHFVLESLFVLDTVRLRTENALSLFLSKLRGRKCRAYCLDTLPSLLVWPARVVLADSRVTDPCSCSSVVASGMVEMSARLVVMSSSVWITALHLLTKRACVACLCSTMGCACDPRMFKHRQSLSLPDHPRAMAAVEVACKAWADCEGSEAVAAVCALCRISGDVSAVAKAVARRLRTFLVQAFSNRGLRYRIRTKQFN